MCCQVASHYTVVLNGGLQPFAHPVHTQTPHRVQPQVKVKILQKTLPSCAPDEWLQRRRPQQCSLLCTPQRTMAEHHAVQARNQPRHVREEYDITKCGPYAQSACPIWLQTALSHHGKRSCGQLIPPLPPREGTTSKKHRPLAAGLCNNASGTLHNHNSTDACAHSTVHCL